MNKFKNNAATTVGVGGISDSATTLPVASNVGFPQDHGFKILVGYTEIMLVTAGWGGTSWTVSRGGSTDGSAGENTSQIAHLAGENVTLLVSAFNFNSFRQEFNVVAYGATGDGTTNDVTAFQAAINDAHALGTGGIVFIPTGTYNIGSALTTYSNVAFQTQGATFSGAGASSVTPLVNVRSIGGVSITGDSLITGSGTGLPALQINPKPSNAGGTQGLLVSALTDPGGLTSESHIVEVDGGTFTYNMGATIANHRHIWFRAPTIDSVTPGTIITRATTLEIEGSPLVGGNTAYNTVNRNAYALKITKGGASISGGGASDLSDANAALVTAGGYVVFNAQTVSDNAIGVIRILTGPPIGSTGLNHDAPRIAFRDNYNSGVPIAIPMGNDLSTWDDQQIFAANFKSVQPSTSDGLLAASGQPVITFAVAPSHFVNGMTVTIDSGGNQETLVISSGANPVISSWTGVESTSTSWTMTGNLTKTHTPPYTITAGPWTITDASTLLIVGPPTSTDDGLGGFVSTTITNAWALRIQSGDISHNGRFVFKPSASKIVPGTASISLRNNADTQDNLKITDVGAITTRNSFTLTPNPTNAGGVFGIRINAAVDPGGITAEAIAFQAGGSTLTFASDIASQRSVFFLAPTYNGTVAQTITTAATVAIAGPPIQGSNITLTKTYSLWVQSGALALGGDPGLIFTQNQSKLIPGATNFSIRDSANANDNMLITNAGNITVRGTISGVTTLTATTLAGTLSTAAQTNITSLGTLTGLTSTGNVTIDKAGTQAFTVDAASGQGFTLQVDTATASAATGLKIKSAAATAGLALSVISTGSANESMTFDAKGSGTMTFGSVSTGNIILGTSGHTLTVNNTTGLVTVAAGGFTLTAGDITLTAGNLIFSAATASIIPGATGLNFRDHANANTNMSLADGGAVTFRGALSGITTLGVTSTATFSKDIKRSFQTPTEAVLVSGVDATAGELIKVTLTAARVVGAPLNPSQGQKLTFTFVQDGTGGWAVTWNAAFHVSWADTNNTANKRSSITFYYDGSAWNQTGGQAPYVA